MLDDASRGERSGLLDDIDAGRAEPASQTPSPSARAATPDEPAPNAQAPGASDSQDRAAPTPKPSWIKRGALAVLIAAALSAGVWYGHGWWTDGRFLVSTDDAYIASDMAIVTPKITGYVADVRVAENQTVRAGDALIEIDPGDYRLQLDGANARIETQKLAVASMEAQRAAGVEQVAQARADRESAASVVAQAQLDRERAEALSRSGAGATSVLDSARAAEAQARARLNGAEAAIAGAQANVSVLEAQGRQAQALVAELEVERDVAARNLSFTTLRAPYDGVVGNLSVQPGDLVSPSRQLAAVVPLNGSYIDANFKETQLHDIAIGESVRIEADALPGVEARGTVVSLSPASGSVFSLLPAENATGNFTKIVQRVPVRIAIDTHGLDASQWRPGLSVTVSVDTRTAPAASQTAAAQPR